MPAASTLWIGVTVWELGCSLVAICATFSDLPSLFLAAISRNYLRQCTISIVSFLDDAG